MPDVSVLRVRLHGQDVGTITYVGAEKTVFAFNDAYVEDSERPTLGLHFKDAFGELLTDFRPYKIKLMPYFSNLLPEGHLRRYLAEKAGIHVDREFFLLWALGQDLPGQSPSYRLTAKNGRAWRMMLLKARPKRTLPGMPCASPWRACSSNSRRYKVPAAA